MQISEHVHLLKIPFQVPISPELKLERFVNLFLVYSEKGITLVDSGVAGAEARIVEWLLSSWDQPRQGEEVPAVLANGQAWLERIKGCVGEEAGKITSSDPLELCRAVVAKLGLPAAAVNPLVAKSFAACR